jgi:hypothetical protein
MISLTGVMDVDVLPRSQIVGHCIQISIWIESLWIREQDRIKVESPDVEEDMRASRDEVVFVGYIALASKSVNGIAKRVEHLPS